MITDVHDLERCKLMRDVYFEDIEPGEKETVSYYEVTKDDIIEFARKYDPQPVHVDEAAAMASTHGGLISSACHTMALSAVLLNQRQRRVAIIAGSGWDDVRFPNPVRPGDRLIVTVECTEKRESKSKPDRGVVRFRIMMENQFGMPVLTYKTTVITARRQ